MAVFSGPNPADVNSIQVINDFGNVKSFSGSASSVGNLVTGTTTELSIKDSFYKVYDLEVGDYVIPNSPPASLPVVVSNIVDFNGRNQYLDFPFSTVSASVTVELWARLATDYTDNTLVSFGNYTVSTTGGRLGYTTSNGDLYGISSATVSSLGLVSNWKHYIFEMRSDASYTNNKIYVNGQLQTLSQQLGTELSTFRNFNDGRGRISAWVNNIGYEMPMSVSMFRIYNKTLSPSEIQQNFNSNRSRFSI